MLRTARFAIVSSLVVIGCGGSSGKHNDGGTIDGATGTAGVGQGGNAGSAGGAGGTAGTSGPPMPSGTMVFQGDEAILLDLGPACTGEVGATGDRWCAFLVGPDTAPRPLFVVNVTKAAAGTSITCGTTGANCLMLTATSAEDDLHPIGFQGDTLVYYDATATPFGWRPGMTAGRMLAVANPTTADVLACTPSSKGTAIVCLRDLPDAMQPDPANTLLSDVIAGKLDDAANPPLVKVDTVISANLADGDVPRFQMGFPVPGGNTVAWSARATAAGPEILKTQTLGAAIAPVTVASDVHNWTASPDGSRWYWMSQVSASTGAGILQDAPFPAGTSPVMISASAIQYDFPTPTSLLVLDTAMRLLGFADPVGAPTTLATGDTGVIAFLALSAQGHAIYVKKVSNTASGQTFTDLFVKKFDGTGACTLTSATDGFPFALFFTPNSGGAIWVQATTAVLANYTRLSDCTKMQAAMNVAGIGAIGDRAVLFADTYDAVLGIASMKFRNIAAGNTLSADPAGQISGSVGTFAVVPSGTTDVITYSVNAGGNDDGIYVRGFGP